MNAAAPQPTHRPSILPRKRDLFERIAGWTIRATGGRWGFLTALAAVVVWAITGPLFQFSEDWQLVINTGTTIITFLMVFLIQNAQNRESRAIHIKLDELILSLNQARNELIDIENLTEEQLTEVAKRYTKVAEKYQYKLKECFPLEDCGEALLKAEAHAYLKQRKGRRRVTHCSPGSFNMIRRSLARSRKPEKTKGGDTSAPPSPSLTPRNGTISR